ncbi:MAG: hypothetical protein J3K34DRAFT_418022 [Monoraphidium minutum]|nr:MAG: hypothetical protein J3K34DRAFT_418022 [Monoraphidium minutum]
MAAAWTWRHETLVSIQHTPHRRTTAPPRAIMLPTPRTPQRPPQRPHDTADEHPRPRGRRGADPARRGALPPYLCSPLSSWWAAGSSSPRRLSRRPRPSPSYACGTRSSTSGADRWCTGSACGGGAWWADRRRDVVAPRHRGPAPARTLRCSSCCRSWRSLSIQKTALCGCAARAGYKSLDRHVSWARRCG